MRIAIALALVLGSCGAKTPPPPGAPAAATPDATLNAAPAARDPMPVPPETDPVPILAPPR